MTTRYALPITVLTIACCAWLGAFVYHDAPIIISDGSIEITFDTNLFADMPQAQPANAPWHSVFVANPDLQAHFSPRPGS